MSAAAAEHVEVFEDDARIVERVAVLEHERRDLAERVLLEEVGRRRQRLGVDDLDAVGKADDVGGDADLADERRSSGRAQDEHGFPLVAAELCHPAGAESMPASRAAGVSQRKPP